MTYDSHLLTGPGAGEPPRWPVAVCGCPPLMLAGRLRQIGRGAWPLLLGVTDWASIASAARRAATLDILVNNAGISGDARQQAKGTLAADALDWCGASQADPLALEGSGSDFCPSARSGAGKQEAPVRSPGSGGRPWRDRAGPAR